jgi:hypothetical protein
MSVLWFLATLGDDANNLPEELPMELPPCPVCNDGRLLPLSNSDTAYACWICTMPECAYVISRNSAGERFYKGTAAVKDKEKGDKRWVEFQF